MQRIHQARPSAPRVTWLGKLGLFSTAVVGVALVGALAVLSLVIAVVLIPVVAIAFLVLRWRIGRVMKQAEGAATQGADTRRPPIIETDYVVLDRDSAR